MERYDAGPADQFKQEAPALRKKIDDSIVNHTYTLKETDIEPSQAKNCCVYVVETAASKKQEVATIRDQQRSLLSEIAKLSERLGDGKAARVNVAVMTEIIRTSKDPDVELKSNLEIFRDTQPRTYAVKVFSQVVKHHEELDTREEAIGALVREKEELMEKLKNKRD